MKITPTHVQQGITALMGAASLLILFTTVAPQAQQAHHYQQQEETAMLTGSTMPLPALKQLPYIGVNAPGTWEKAVVNPLKIQAVQSQIALTTVEGSADRAEPIVGLPTEVRQFQLKLSATGTYEQLQIYQQNLLRMFPYATLKDMQYRLNTPTSAATGKSPVIQGTWILNLVARIS